MEEKKENKENSEEKKEKKEHELDLEIKKKVHHSKHVTKHKKAPQLKIKKESMWQFASAVLAIALVVMIVKGGECASPSGAVTSVEAGQSAVTFINDYLLDSTKTAVLKTTADANDLHKVSFEVDGKEYPSYVSPDGKLLFLQDAINMQEIIDQAEGQPSGTDTAPANQPAPDVVKADKPEVEVFVMSHCPYGTQIEKGILPVAELLGDKIDFKVRFVYYAMHGKTEVDEQLNQYCIQKEFPDKFNDYLACFLEEGKGEECIVLNEIDKPLLDACVEEIDTALGVTDSLEDQSSWLNGRYPKFDTDKAENEKYGVGGSPTLVINGKQASSSRDSASLLRTVCASFTNAPEECDTELSSASPSPGFGYDASASATSGSCG